MFCCELYIFWRFQRKRHIKLYNNNNNNSNNNNNNNNNNLTLYAQVQELPWGYWEIGIDQQSTLSVFLTKYCIDTKSQQSPNQDNIWAHRHCLNATCSRRNYQNRLLINGAIWHIYVQLHEDRIRGTNDCLSYN